MFTLILYIFTLMQAVQSGLTLDLRGTLVITILTRDGLIIVADKRTNDRVRGDRDSAVKITQLDKYSAFSTTGTPNFLHPLTYSPMFSCDDVVKSYYESYPLQIPQSFQGLAKTLADTFRSFLRTLSYSHWPQSGNPPDNTLFQLLLFHYDTVAHEYQLASLRFSYVKKYPEPTIEIRGGPEPKDSLNFARAYLAGNTAVYEEITRGSDHRFDDLRSNSEVRRFLFERVPFREVSGNEAVSFAKFFIRECSKRTPLIDSSPFHIGSRLDVALIEPKQGFRWLEVDSIEE